MMAFPENPVLYQSYVDPITKTVYVWDGTQWVSGSTYVGSDSRVVACVETAAALRAYRRTDSTCQGAVQTLGALTAGDGGGGTWRWDASSTMSDNTGTVLLPTGHVGPGRYLRVIDGTAIHLAWFGAKDETLSLDAQPLFTAAIDAAIRLHVRKIVVCTCAIGSPVVVPESQLQFFGSEAGVTFGTSSGDFQAVIFKTASFTGDAMFILDYIPGGRIQHVTFSGIGLDGNSHPGGGIKALFASYFLIENCTMRNMMAPAIHLEGGDFYYIDRTRLSDNPGGGLYITTSASLPYGTFHVYLTRSHIVHAGGFCVKCTREDATGGVNNHLTIDKCLLEGYLNTGGATPDAIVAVDSQNSLSISDTTLNCSSDSDWPLLRIGSDMTSFTDLTSAYCKITNSQLRGSIQDPPSPYIYLDWGKLYINSGCSAPTLSVKDAIVVQSDPNIQNSLLVESTSFDDALDISKRVGGRVQNQKLKSISGGIQIIQNTVSGSATDAGVVSIASAPNGGTRFVHGLSGTFQASLYDAGSALKYFSAEPDNERFNLINLNMRQNANQAEPPTPTAGQICLANSATWDPLGLGGNSIYWVWYTGTVWRAFNQRADGSSI